MRGTPVVAIDPPPVERELKPARRLAVVQVCMWIFAIVIVAQLVRWQVFEREACLRQAAIALSYPQEVPPQRGLILDRRQDFMALNNYDYTIYAAPNQIPEQDTAYVASKLAPALGIPQEELVSRLEGDALYAPLARQVPRETGKGILALDLPGIIAQPLAMRVYPEHTVGAHLLGFVAGDAKEGTKGCYGVEGYYDRTLKGKAGLREEQYNPWEQPVAFADRRSQAWKIPQDGTTLVLSVDRTIQYLIEQELRAAVERYGAESGCIVVMDPQTGALLAAASYPTYDPNHFAETDSELFVDPVIGRQYEPGSTFKVITMAAALDAGVIRPTDVYYDAGYIEVGGRVLHNWDNRSYGQVTMIDVMVHSLNTGAAHVSTLLGPGRFYDYVTRFGFGDKTGVDLEGEVPGAVRRQGDPEWHESDLGTNAFGQGIAVTPIQMVVAVGAIANHGYMMQPYVVEQMIQGDRVSHVKQVAVRQVVREDVARTLTEMMVEVVERGATMAQVDGYRIAGKTGTAQTPVVGGYDPNLTIASFIGFAPVDDPRFVALVKLDKPTASPWGSSTAAPTFANVARILFTQLAIPPDAVRMAAR
jgi:cell division protein FtsI/penicillin-binding protein 2